METKCVKYNEKLLVKENARSLIKLSKKLKLTIISYVFPSY